MSENRRKVSVAATRQIARVATITVADTRESNLHIRSVPVLITHGDADYAITAGQLMEPRRITLTGDVIGETMFDGSQDVTVVTSVPRMNGALTLENIGFGFSMNNGRISVDVPALINDEFSVGNSGKIEINKLDVTKLYIPEDTELIIGEVDDNG